MVLIFMEFLEKNCTFFDPIEKVERDNSLGKRDISLEIKKKVMIF